MSYALWLLQVWASLALQLTLNTATWELKPKWDHVTPVLKAIQRLLIFAKSKSLEAKVLTGNGLQGYNDLGPQLFLCSHLWLFLSFCLLQLHWPSWYSLKKVWHSPALWPVVPSAGNALSPLAAGPVPSLLSSLCSSFTFPVKLTLTTSHISLSFIQLTFPFILHNLVFVLMFSCLPLFARI